MVQTVILNVVQSTNCVRVEQTLVRFVQTLVHCTRLVYKYCITRIKLQYEAVVKFVTIVILFLVR